MTTRPRLVVASNNAGKIAEFRNLLGDHADVLSMIDLGIESPEETGSTFEENAELKARFIHDMSGSVTIADDSGLEVDALNGQPGVRSARYAGEQHNDADNRAFLLANMLDIPAGERTCRFVAALSLIDGEGNLRTVRGICEGTIGFEERGDHGFGYDSLFVTADGRTMAELTPDEKGAISHRGQAVRAIADAVRAALAATVPSARGNLP